METRNDNNEINKSTDGEVTEKQYFISSEKFKLILKYQDEIFKATEVSPSIRKMVNDLINDKNLGEIKDIIIRNINNATAKIEIASLSEKLVGSDQQNQEKQARIDELHRQNQQVQANLEHYRAASLEQRLTDQQRYEQQQKQLEQTVQQGNQELTQLRNEKISLQHHYQQTSFENSSMKIQLDNINAQHELITSRLTDAVSELAKKTQDQQHWQDRYQALQEKNDELNQSHVNLMTQHAMLSQQSETMKTELNELHDQNKLLAHEKWILGQEKAQLYGQLKQLETRVNQ
jgi:chromosome segregation ATPase